MKKIKEFLSDHSINLDHCHNMTIDEMESFHEFMINSRKNLALAAEKFPSAVYVNEKKKTVAIIFELKINGEVTTESFVSKASEKDKFNPEIGFLVAYLYKTLNVSKSKLPNQYKEVLQTAKPTFLKGYLYSFFMNETGFSLERAKKYIDRKTK